LSYWVTIPCEAKEFGFNGQVKFAEMDNQSYTAEYWQYDSRIGKRWNRDPIVKVSESPYSAFGNNPIMLSDPNGGADTINMTRKSTFDKRQHRAVEYSKPGLNGSAAPLFIYIM
jgi:RHS repeat-associated protein